MKIAIQRNRVRVTLESLDVETHALLTDCREEFEPTLKKFADMLSDVVELGLAAGKKG